MVKVKTLYNICIENLVLKSAHIEDLSGVPFEPYLLDLLNYLFKDETCLMALPKDRWRNPWKFVNIPNLLGRITDAHGSTLRQPKYASFGSLRLTAEYMQDKYARIISQPDGTPQFITQLDLSMSWFSDEDVPYLKSMVNLMVLDLSATKITDYGVSHLARLTRLDMNNNPRVGLRHLEHLSLAYNNNITDGSLKHLANMTPTLYGIDLSTTNVNRQIATGYLKKHNYVCNDETPPLIRRTPTPTPTAKNARRNLDDVRVTMQQNVYFMRQLLRKEMCPTHPLTLITHKAPFPDGNDEQQQEERKGCTTTVNDNLYLLLTKDDCFGLPFDGYDTTMKLWWTKGKGPHQPLVFTKPSSETTTSSSSAAAASESNVGKKRPFENMVSDGTVMTPQRQSLSVKQSQTASSLIDNFQW